jgi:hypothetical protein
MSELTKRDAELLMRLVDAEIKRICDLSVPKLTEADRKDIAELDRLFALEDQRE